MGNIKTFKGLLADGGIETINLTGGDPVIGYKIVKFEAITENPGDTAYEHVLQIFTVEPTGAAQSRINFDDDTLLAVAFTKGDELTYRSAGTTDVVFDKEVLNQDIYITQVDTKGSLSCNYYIELEEFKMKDPETAVVNYKAALLHGE